MKYPDMTKLDFHVHCNEGKPEDVERLVEYCRTSGTVACLSGGLRYGSHDYLPNDRVLEICKKYPECLIPLAKLDLWESADVNEVYRYVEQGFKGFKCIYPYYEYDHDIYMPLYEAAEKCHTPLLFHTGNFRPSPADAVYRRPVLKNMDPINLDRIARSFPELKLVMAHMGTRIFQDEASQYIQMLPNLYTDLGGCGQWKRLQPNELAAMLAPEIRVVDTEMKNYRKLVLGSDAYVTHPHIMKEGAMHYRLLLERIGVPQEIIAGIMGRTVASWLGVELAEG